MPDNGLDWTGLYERIGALVEQNTTLSKRTDDHESRLRTMDEQLHQQGQTLHELTGKVEETGRKVDRLDGKVDDLSVQVSRAIIPRTRWRKITGWLGARVNGVIVACLGALGSGVGGYLIAFLQHK